MRSRRQSARLAIAWCLVAGFARVLSALLPLAGSLFSLTQPTAAPPLPQVDADGDGHLTRSELDDLLAKGGERMTRAELDEVMEQFDLDGDGRIDFTEFSQMLVSFSRQMRGMRPPLARREGGEPLSNAEHKPKDRSGSRGRRAAAGASSALKKGFGSLRGKLGRRGSGAEESGSEAGSGAEDGGRLSKSVTESAPEREPSQLRSWDCDRLGGTLQVAAEAGVEGPQFTFSLHEATEVYLTLRMDRGLPGGHRNLDLSLFLMQHAAAEEEAGRAAHGPVAGNRSGRTETDPSTTPPPSLIAVSPTQYKKDPAIRIHLSPGKYTVVPFTTGCKLRKRTAQPSRSVALTRPAGDSHELTAECTKALKQVFQRLDADGRGSVSREEYSFLQVRTDGEPCDDETWEYVSENFNLEDGGLTEQGFLDMYGMFAASCEGDDTQFYPTFKCLGYNQRLQLDEAVMFKVCSRAGVSPLSWGATSLCFVSIRGAARPLLPVPCLAYLGKRGLVCAPVLTLACMPTPARCLCSAVARMCLVTWSPRLPIRPCWTRLQLQGWKTRWVVANRMPFLRLQLYTCEGRALWRNRGTLLCISA